MSPDTPEAQEMLRRFERDRRREISKCQTKDDLLRTFKYWQNRTPSLKQMVAVRNFGDELGIPSIAKKEKIKEKIIEHKPKVRTRRKVWKQRIRTKRVKVRRKTKKGIKITYQDRDIKTGRYVKIRRSKRKHKKKSRRKGR